MNKPIRDLRDAEPNPLILGVGLSMKQVQHRVTQFRHFTVAWRGVDEEILLEVVTKWDGFLFNCPWLAEASKWCRGSRVGTASGAP